MKALDNGIKRATSAYTKSRSGNWSTGVISGNDGVYAATVNDSENTFCRVLLIPRSVPVSCRIARMDFPQTDISVGDDRRRSLRRGDEDHRRRHCGASVAQHRLCAPSIIPPPSPGPASRQRDKTSV